MLGALEGAAITSISFAIGVGTCNLGRGDREPQSPVYQRLLSGSKP